MSTAIERRVSTRTFGAVWAAAEAALPAGWVLSLTSPNPTIRPYRYQAEAFNGAGGYRQAWGDTPVAALLVLTANLPRGEAD